jgi:hypothetical protein
MIAFRGYPDEEKQYESELKFWLLARQIAPRATGELLLHVGSEDLYTPEHLQERRELLAAIDKVLAEPETLDSASSSKEAGENDTA